jgi:hypothetical protein
MQAYLIDPFARTVEPIDYDGDYRSIYRLIGNGCSTFTALGLWHPGDAVFLDDEGLFKKGLMGFVLDGHIEHLFGRGVVLGSDAEGDEAPAKIGLDELRRRVRWSCYVTTGGC